MTEQTDNAVSKLPINEPSERDFVTLRHLLLGVEFDELLQLKNQFQNPKHHSEAVAQIISEAIEIRIAQDDSLADVLGPTIEDALGQSIQRNPKEVADVLYPVMGPAIRKSIRETMSYMFESFNRAIEQSLSPKTLSWRFDAWRSGKQYSEIVMLKTMLYQVEQVFLIHGKTGLLLHHMIADSVTSRDPDLVSAMLTAIQDFIADSFSTLSEDKLTTLQFGGLTILVEQGPLAVIATAVRGHVTQDYREVMITALEQCHLQYSQNFLSYEGDNTALTKLDSLLQPCLKRVQQQSKKRKPWFVWVILVVIVVVFLAWQFLQQQRQTQWNDIINVLSAEPGVVVLQQALHRRSAQVTGLADPLARTPKTILAGIDMPDIQIDYEWQPYLSLEPTIAHRRLNQQINQQTNPPEGVTLTIDNGVLVVAGEASAQWLTVLQSRIALMPSVTSLNTDGLQVLDSIADAIMGVRAEIEQTQIYFKPGETSPDADAEPVLEKLAANIQQLVLLNESTLTEVNIVVTGYADSTGRAELNAVISEQRAENIVALLEQYGVPRQVFKIGTDLTEAAELPTGIEHARRVSFKIIQPTNVDRDEP